MPAIKKYKNLSIEITEEEDYLNCPNMKKCPSYKTPMIGSINMRKSLLLHPLKQSKSPLFTDGTNLKFSLTRQLKPLKTSTRRAKATILLKSLLK